MKQKLNKKLSIICTTFNSGKTLQRTIDSIKNQTFQDFEFIIVDAKSEDKTMEIIRDNSDVISKYISEKDKSIFDGMNKGLKLAKGDWVFFIGSDDFLHNEKVLEKIFNSEINSETDLIIGNVKYSNNKIFKSYWNWRIYCYCSVHHQSAFYKRKLFNDNYYYPERNHPSDYGINVGLYVKGIKHQYFDIIVSVYALGGDSSQVIWTRYGNEIKLRNIHLNSYLLKSILAFQTFMRYFIKKTLLKFNISINI